MEKRIINFFGFTCISFSFVFLVLETEYFGHNFIPKTKEEILCDLISLILNIAGILILKLNKQD